MNSRPGYFALIVALAFSHGAAFAATKYWKNSVASGNWSNGANWSAVSAAGADNGGAPVATGDIAQMAPDDGSAHTITYDVTAPTLAAVFVDLSGSLTNRTTLSISGNTLTTAVLGVGFNGRAQINQSAGLVNQNNNLFDTVLGQNTGGDGIYNLSGTGSLSVARDILMGNASGSSGVIQQTGGTNTVAGNIQIGHSAGATGVYTISAGSVSASSINVGNGGTGILAISGTASVFANNNLSINGTSDLNLNGGTLRFNTASGLNRLNYTAGTIKLAGSRTIGTDTIISTLYGASPTIPVNKGLSVEGTAFVATPLAITSGALSSLSMRVADTGTASVSVSTGGTVSTTNDAYIGYQAGSNGTATLTGAGSSWTTAGTTVIGNSGTGTLNISNGASATHTNVVTLAQLAGSAGSANIDGPTSTWSLTNAYIVGNEGNGQMSVTNGADVTSNSGLIALDATSTSSATISAAGSTWTNLGFLTVGNDGDATMTVSNGAVVSNSIGYIGYGPTSASQVNVTGSGSEWNNTSDLRVGENGGGTISIQDGGRVYCANGFLGKGAGSSGVVLISGPESGFVVDGSLRVGDAGFGSINITSGSFLASSSAVTLGNSTGSSGLVQVIDSDSFLGAADNINVGASGSGNLTIGSGATVSTLSALNIGASGTVQLFGGTLRMLNYSKHASGTFNYLSGTIQLISNRTVGTDSIISTFFGSSPLIPVAKQLYVEGTATLVVPMTIDGGQFTVGNIAGANLLNFQRGTFRMTMADLAVDSTGQFGPTVELASGRNFIIDENTDVSPTGIVLVNSGASFTSGSITNSGEIALAGLTARLAGGTVQNIGLLRGDGRIDSAVTNAAAGEVRVGAGQRLIFTSAALTNQGQVNVTGGTLDLRQGATNTGTINLAGGTGDVYGNITVPVGGRISVGGSTQANFFGNITQNGVVSIAPGSTATFFGNVSGTGTFALAGTAEFLGAISPGNSPGVISVTVAATLYNSATLQIELAGTAPGTQYDQLHTSGPLAISGTLAVSLINGFTPQVGNSFDILDWASRTGTFTSIRLPALAAGLQWNTSQLYTTGILSVASAGIPGDFNNSGTVDAADYIVWRKGLGTTYTLDDFTLWRAHFGQTGGSGNAVNSSTVPEPIPITLLVIAFLLTATSYVPKS